MVHTCLGVFFSKVEMESRRKKEEDARKKQEAADKKAAVRKNKETA